MKERARVERFRSEEEDLTRRDREEEAREKWKLLHGAIDLLTYYHGFILRKIQREHDAWLRSEEIRLDQVLCVKEEAERREFEIQERDLLDEELKERKLSLSAQNPPLSPQSPLSPKVKGENRSMEEGEPRLKEAVFGQRLSHKRALGGFAMIRFLLAIPGCFKDRGAFEVLKEATMITSKTHTSLIDLEKEKEEAERRESSQILFGEVPLYEDAQDATGGVEALAIDIMTLADRQVTNGKLSMQEVMTHLSGTA